MRKKTIATMILAAAASYSIVPTVLTRGANVIAAMARVFKRKEKCLYLTFDDGPGIHTPAVLAVLQKYEIPATFFMVGEFAKKNPDLVHKIQENGHAIGLHSRWHKNPLWEAPFSCYRDWNESKRILDELQIPVSYVRPPWGISNLAFLFWCKKQQVYPVFWNVMAEDWQADTTPEEIAAKIIRRTKADDVICLHDGRGEKNAPLRTAQALEIALPKLLQQGYRFCCLDERKK